MLLYRSREAGSSKGRSAIWLHLENRFLEVSFPMAWWVSFFSSIRSATDSSVLDRESCCLDLGPSSEWVERYLRVQMACFWAVSFIELFLCWRHSHGFRLMDETKFGASFIHMIIPFFAFLSGIHYPLYRDVKGIKDRFYRLCGPSKKQPSSLCTSFKCSRKTPSLLSL